MALKERKTVAPEWVQSMLEDDDGSEPTRFHIRALTESELTRVYNHLNAEGSVVLPEGLAAAFQLGCIGFENFLDKEGQPMSFSRANLRRVPFEVQIEIGQQVHAKSVLEAPEVKNS